MRVLSVLMIGTIAVLGQQQPLVAEVESRKPIMVSNLGGEVAAAPTSAPALPATVAVGASSYSNGGSLGKLQESIEQQQVTLEQLSKQLEDGLRQKQRLQLAQRLMTAIVSLKKAERVLNRIDHAVKKYKRNIKKFGEQADEIADSIKRSEKEFKREQTELGKKLDGLRASLAKQSRKLSGLASRRQRVVGILRKWKEHVATLRDAHEAYNTNSNARRGPSFDALQSPPSTSSVLNEIGLSKPPSRDSFLRGALAPSDYRTKLNELVEAKTVTADAADAAAAEVFRATVREMGGHHNLPAFQEAEIAQPRFASAEAAAEDDASSASDSGADIDAELDAEVGMDLEEPGAVETAHV